MARGERKNHKYIEKIGVGPNARYIYDTKTSNETHTSRATAYVATISAARQASQARSQNEKRLKKRRAARRPVHSEPIWEVTEPEGITGIIGGSSSSGNSITGTIGGSSSSGNSITGTIGNIMSPKVRGKSSAKDPRIELVEDPSKKKKKVTKIKKLKIDLRKRLDKVKDENNQNKRHQQSDSKTVISNNKHKRIFIKF